MGFLEGYIGGVGTAARETAHNMLEAQLQKYKSAGRIWEAMAQDQNYHPAIRESFLKKAELLYGAHPFNKGTLTEANKVLGEDPSKSRQEAYKAMEMLGMSPGKYYDQSGYHGREQELQFKADMQRQQEEIKLDALFNKLKSMSSRPGEDEDSFFAPGLTPDHPAYKDMVRVNKQRFVGGHQFEEFEPREVAGRWGSYFRPTARLYLQVGNQVIEVDPSSVPAGDAGRSVVNQITRGPLGEVTQTGSMSIPLLPGVGAANQQPTATTAPPRTQTPKPAPAAPLAPNVPPVPTLAELGPVPTMEQIQARFSNAATNPAEGIALGMASRLDPSLAAYKRLNAVGKANVDNVLRQKGIIVLNDKEQAGLQDARKATVLIYQMAGLIDHIQKDPLGALVDGSDVQYQQIRDGFGSILARRTFEQVGQLAVIESEWAKAPFAKPWKAFLGGVTGHFFPRWRRANEESVRRVLELIDQTKGAYLGARPGDWVAGIGPKDNVVRTYDPFNPSKRIVAPPIGAAPGSGDVVTRTMLENMVRIRRSKGKDATYESLKREAIMNGKTVDESK